MSDKNPFDEIYAVNVMVLGIGCTLYSDEGFGVRVIEKMERYFEFPNDVLLVDGGVLGINLLGVISKPKNLIVVDAIKNKGQPGDLYRLAGDAIPDARTDLSLSGFDEVGRPLFETRGIQPFHDFFQGPDLWNTRDYKSVISQLPKLGMNFIGLKTYPRYLAYEERVREFGPTGPELSAAELSQYDILLEEQAYPFEEEAIELHEVNAARTADGVYDEWVAKSIEALAVLVPVRYAKREIGENLVSVLN